MGKEGKGNCKRKNKGRVRFKDRCSDDSDEDYVVSNEEEEESEAELEKYCSSSDGDEPEEGFCSLFDDEDYDLDVVDEERKRKRKFGRPKPKEDVFGSGKKVRSRKRNMVVSEEIEEEEEEDDGVEDEEDGDYEEEEDEAVKKIRKRKVDVKESRRIRSGMRKRVCYDKGKDGEDFEDVDEVESPKAETVSLGTEETQMILPNVKKDGSYENEKEDDRDYEQEFDDDDDDDDDEFILDDDVSLEEEDEDELVGRMNKKKNNLKAGKRSKQKRRSGEGRKRRKKISARKQPVGKRGRKKQVRKRKRESDEDDCGDFIDDSTTVRKNAKKKSFIRSKRSALSDSDFVSSGPSDYEFTISEEEREQVREASKLLRTSRTISSSLTINQENVDTHQIRKPPVKKGKEKVEIAKREVVKQVCGICLSEEDKRRLRGTLDCCSHYFCFTCIMEWSKVESRCPLCKQRFKTISKPSRSTLGVDLREVLIPVPERDQVYQPTEEELRSYLDPYENVICSECHQGGDDGLMLLCDLCDSSAHTYCVGLGREVPEGSWYCEGCKPVALAFSGSEASNPVPDHRTANNRPPPSVNSVDFIDPALLSSPHNPVFHGFGNLPSPRFPNTNNILETSPSGSGAPTLSRRRSIHRHIQNLFNANRVISSMAGNGRTDETAHADNDFLTSQVDRGREPALIQPMRAREMVTPLCTITEEKPRDIFSNASSSAQAGDLVCSISGNLRREEAVQTQTNSGFINQPVSLELGPGHIGMGPFPSSEQFQLNSCSTVYRVAPEGDFSVAREQLQLTVKTHLRSLSRHTDLGQGSFNDIATYSIHTILAACGLEHRSNLVHTVPPPVKCSHLATITAEQASNSLMKGCCISCFDSFVKDVVKMIMDTRNAQWLSLGL